jgi:NhaP-type Na+/H+ or K+/H+ antiporter
MTDLLYLGFGVMIVCGAWVPLFLRKVPLSLPMVALGAGLLLPDAVGTGDPLRTFAGPLEVITEIVLLASIYGAGLNIDRRFAPAQWGSAWRLLLVVMPISIALITGLGIFLLGLPLGFALLLAAVLSPTDPVLAASVQVGPPGSGEEGEVRFALTSEAGMNDGLALPFVALSLLLIQGHVDGPADLWGWLLRDLVWQTLAGAAFGALFGWAIIVANRLLPRPLRLDSSNEGIAGIGLSLMAFGLAGLLGINGFVAVFFAAVAVRNTSPTHDYSRQMSDSSKQVERVMMVFLMVLFGYSVRHGLLAGFDWAIAVFAVLVLLVVRPVATLAGTVGSPALDGHSRAALAFLGIRGIGTIYYMIYAAGQVPQVADQALFAAAGTTVLVSVLLYGMISSYVMDGLDRSRRHTGPPAEGSISPDPSAKSP